MHYFDVVSFRQRRALLALSGCLIFGLSLAAATAAKDRTDVPKDAAAVVNGEALPQRIVEAFMLNGQAALGVDPKTEQGREMLAKLRQNIVDEQIDRLLITQETKRRKIAPSKAEIDRAEATTITSMVDEARYRKFLQSNHFSREDYRQYVIGSALAGEAMIAAFGKEISITEEDMRR